MMSSSLKELKKLVKNKDKFIDRLDSLESSIDDLTDEIRKLRKTMEK